MEKTEKAANNQKIKLLLMMEYLRRETDEEHPVTTNALRAYLKSQGISCDRRTLYQDIEVLNRFGFRVERKQVVHAMGYYLPGERLTASELRFLTDAVEAADFLPEKQAALLKSKLAETGAQFGLQPDGDALCFHPRERTDENVFENVRLLSRCITEKKRVGFRYFDLNEDRERVFRKAGRRYYTDPAALIYDEGYYYLTVYTEKYDSLTTYRVDRMADIRMLEENISSKAMEIRKNAAVHTAQVFNMFGGETEKLRLRFPGKLLGSVYDKFGEDIRVKRLDAETLEAECAVQVSPTFFGWVFQFGGEMRIAGNARAARAYRKALQKAWERLEV